MSEKVISMLINRIEEMGYKLGGEAVELLQQYYPIVRHKVMTQTSIFLAITLIILGFGVFLIIIRDKFSDEKDDYDDTSVRGFITGLGVVISFIGSILSLYHFYKLLNVDYYTIQTILEQLKGGLQWEKLGVSKY